MFTVLRILSTNPNDANVMAVVAAMNQLVPSAQVEPRRRGDGLVATVSSRSDWPTHATDIEQYLAVVGQHVRSLVDGGSEVTLDIAVEPDDAASWLTTIRLPHSVIESLGRCGASLEFSVYPGGNGSSRAHEDGF